MILECLNSDEHKEFKIKCEDNHTPEDKNFQPWLRPFLLSGFLSAKPSPVGHGQRGPGEQGVGEGVMSYGAQSMRDV